MDDRQRSLFPEPPLQPAAARWKFPGEPHTDYISDDLVPVVAFCFNVATLEQSADVYSSPVYCALLAALRDLSRCSESDLRETSFTVYAGDSLATGATIFVLAVETQSPKVTDFLARYFNDVWGYICVEASSSRDLVPAFRYDAGFVIEYSDPELAGTTYVDDGDWWGSGVVILRRQWRLPQDIGRRKTCYTRLLNDQRRRTSPRART